MTGAGVFLCCGFVLGSIVTSVAVAITFMNALRRQK